MSSKMGHTLKDFYYVNSSNSNQIEAIYCDFSK